MACFCSRWRASATSRVSASLVVSINTSPALGTLFSPTIWTGIDGPALLISLPWSLRSLLTRPHAGPHSSRSPIFKVPFCTSPVTTTPSPLSTLASITEPCAGSSGVALRFITSACNSTLSSKSSIPKPFFADTSTHWASPPNSSTNTPYFMRSVLTLSGSAPSLSILLIATTIGHRDACAAAMHSLVCSITPSSAATTNTTMSVTLAPLFRISLNAACPGVSINVTIPRSLLSDSEPSSLSSLAENARARTENALMPCVMPPASP
mmetsp:Transcript_24694/g.35448  ORF Transcript_24694/g.35448 Transcript_24694/m.35448 type:complete len:266 (-) Transcript_24694:1609-2406(-)